MTARRATRPPAPPITSPARFLARAAAGHGVRVEIPFTDTHWEAYRVASEFPLARGWERQLDRDDNGLFYDGRAHRGAV